MKKLNLNINEIIRLYRQGFSHAKIAKIFNCSESTISKRLIAAKIEPIPNSIYRRQYTVDHDYFEVIDSYDKAYWLGFMFADGNVYNNYIKLGTCDLEVEEKFRDSLQSNYKIYKSNIPNRIKPLYYITIRSNKMAKDLANHGCIPSKSLVLKFPNTISKKYIYDFIRGYCDGDGCIMFNKTNYIQKRTGIKTIHYKPVIELCGTLEFLTGVQNLFGFGKIHKDKRRISNSYYWNCYSKNNCIDFINKVYSNSTLYLTRKYLKTQEIINFYKNKNVQRL